MMPTNNATTTAIVRQWCEKHPDVPHLTLARMIYAKHTKLFTNVTAVRNSVRYHRGTREKECKRTQPCIAYTAPAITVRHEYRAPESHAEAYEPYVINGAQRILRLSDIHYPFHDPKALEAAINYGVKNDPTVILLAGDILDCHDQSEYARDPRHRYTETELRMVGDEFKQLRQVFPKARIVYQFGNHCDRMEKYLMRKAPELWGLPGLDLPGLIAMVGGPEAIMGIEWVKDKRIVKTGKLSHLHGHEFMGGGGINPARWLYLRTGVNAICGHFHRISEHSEPRLDGEEVVCYSTGCLSDLKPRYMPHNKWVHGFAWVDVEKGGNFRVKNIRVNNGRVY
jgi:predicted phosphodiesterase